MICCTQPMVFVTKLAMEMVTFVPQHASIAVGRRNVNGVPHWRFWFGPKLVNTGGVVSTTVTVWLHVTPLLQQSIASQVRVIIAGHDDKLFVIVLTTVTVTFVPQHASIAVGGSKVQALPHTTVLFVAHVKSGGVVSITDTAWLQIEEVLAQQSTATHLRV